MRSLALLFALTLLAPAIVRPDQATLLDDVAFPGRWRTDIWNKAPGAVELAQEAPDAAADEGSLAITIDWPLDDEFRFFSVRPETPRGPVPYRLKEVSLWVKAASDPHPLEIHFKDAKDNDVKLGFGPMTFDGWQRLARPVPADWEQPLALQSITTHNWGMKGAGGGVTLHVARLEGTIDETDRLVPGDDHPEMLLGATSAHGISDDAGRCTLALRLLTWTQIPLSLTVHDELTDRAGQHLAGDETPVEFAGDSSLRLPQELRECGCFTCDVRVAQAGEAEPLATGTVRLARLTPQGTPLTEDERLRSAIGVNTHIGAPWEAFGKMGIHWARDYSWGWLGRGETAPYGQGRDFSAIAADALRHGVMVLPVTMGAFRNEAETGFLRDGPAIAAGFRDLSRAFPGLPYWEIDNEYEYHLRDKGFDVADYARTLRAAHEGLSQAGEAKLVLNGTAGIRYDLAEELLGSEARDSFSVVNSHFYTGTAPPELGISDTNVGGEQRRKALTALDQLRRISELAHDAAKESWLTEIGWDVTNGPAVGEELQALYLPRVYLLSRWVGADKVFWFYDRDVPDGTGIFSTCGLIRTDGSLRPSGVAMAALSRETARAEMAGSLDLGEDRWALVLRRPAGGWTVAAWSVLEEHPLPKELASAEALDVFGNPAQPQRLTPAVAYFHLPELPPAWDRQRRAAWQSSSVLVTCPAGTAQSVISAPGATVRWGDLPEGVASAGWTAEGDLHTDTLTVAATVPVGRYPLSAIAQGDGWRRTWQATLVVEPPLKVAAPSGYEPNQAELLTVTASRLGGEFTARLLDDPGTVAPGTFTLAPGERQRFAVVPSAGATGPLRLELAMPNGVRQEVVLYPLRTALPRAADVAIDGDLTGWPEGSLLPCVSPDPAADGTSIRVRLAWAPAGLHFGVEMPAQYLTQGQPSAFWDSTNVELFVDPAAGSGDWSGTCRQFWLTPVREDNTWTVVAGQWHRVTGQGSAPEDRCDVRVIRTGETVVFEGFVPAEVLGRAPEAGATWRCAVSAQGVSPGGKVEVGWPRAKADGVLEGPRGWGLVLLR